MWYCVRILLFINLCIIFANVLIVTEIIVQSFVQSKCTKNGIVYGRYDNFTGNLGQVPKSLQKNGSKVFHYVQYL